MCWKEVKFFSTVLPHDSRSLVACQSGRRSASTKWSLQRDERNRQDHAQVCHEGLKRCSKRKVTGLSRLPSGRWWRTTCRIWCELDVAIGDLSNNIQECENEKSKTRHEEFCQKLSRVLKRERRCHIRSRSPRHGEDGAQLFASVEDAAALEAWSKVWCNEWKTDWQVGEEVQEAQKPLGLGRAYDTGGSFAVVSGQNLKRAAMSLKADTGGLTWWFPSENSYRLVG